MYIYRELVDNNRTSMKCLPHTKISTSKGMVLHDWHAEILAIRSFNQFLIQECYNIASGATKTSEFLRSNNQNGLSNTHAPPFALKEGTDIYMYCSEAPCKGNLHL